MALGFGRKKAAEETPATPEIEAAPVPAHAPSSPPNEALDAFDLDAFSVTPPANAPAGVATGVTIEPDPFGDFTAAPSHAADPSGSAFEFPDFETVSPTEMSAAATVADVSPANTTTLDAGDADADAPDFDKLYAIEQAQAAQNAARTAAPAPFVPPTATMQADAAPFYEPQVPVSAEIEPEIEPQPKKKLPLVPILGALAILALAGGGAAYFSGQSAPDEDETEISTPSPTVLRDAPPVQNAPAQSAPVQSAPASSNPGAAPRLAPPGVSPVTPGIAPVSAQLEQMRAIWKRGAAAKKRGDYAGARRYWNQGLKIQPNNIGFQESIAKLPK